MDANPMDFGEVNESLDLVELMLYEGQSEEALSALQALYAMTMPSSSRGRALALEVIGLEDQDRHAEANRLIDTTMKEDGDDLGFILAAGVQFSELDAIDQAEVFLRNLCDLDPDNHLAWFNLGIALDRSEQYEEALQCHEQAVRREPQFMEAHLHVAFTLRLLDRLEESLGRYLKYQEALPGDYEGWAGAAQVLTELDRHAEALDAFAEAARIEPDSLDVYFDWAISAIQARDEIALAACIDRMIEIDPDDWRTLLTRADFEESQDNIWDAWELLNLAFDEVEAAEAVDPEPFDYVTATVLRFANRRKLHEHAGELVGRIFEYVPLSSEVLDALLVLEARLSNAAASFQVVLKGSVTDDTGVLRGAYRVYGVAVEDPEEAGVLALAFEERCTGAAWKVFNVMQISPPDEGSVGVYWMAELSDRPPSATPERG